jgi:hypothetical protein
MGHVYEILEDRTRAKNAGGRWQAQAKWIVRFSVPPTALLVIVVYMDRYRICGG